jgi:hypothetical protein
MGARDLISWSASNWSFSLSFPQSLTFNLLWKWVKSFGMNLQFIWIPVSDFPPSSCWFWVSRMCECFLLPPFNIPSNFAVSRWCVFKWICRACADVQNLFLVFFMLSVSMTSCSILNQMRLMHWAVQKQVCCNHW